ncbi:MAG: glutaconate CoA-transferase, partial [Firmicutes bacterium]|nr:glutaconate CoA-transferase [Bacillota bacterium]
AARSCIVTCEEIVPDRELRRDPGANSLPGLCVDAVVHCPWGAHPCQVYNYYDYDLSYLRDYDRASRTQAEFNTSLEQWVYGLDHEAYLDKLGRGRLEKLKVHEELGYVPSPEEVQL